MSRVATSEKEVRVQHPTRKMNYTSRGIQEHSMNTSTCTGTIKKWAGEAGGCPMKDKPSAQKLIICNHPI